MKKTLSSYKIQLGIQKTNCFRIQTGLFTKSQLQIRYNIRGNSCIPSWLVKYGNFTYS